MDENLTPLSGNIWIVEEKSNPTTDYYVTPRLETSNVTLKKFSLQIPHQLPDDSTITLIFVRYLSNAWKNWVDQNRHRIERLIYLFDDDMFDLSASATTPLKYRWKLYQKAYMHQHWIRQSRAEIWASTPYLAEKYRSWSPILVPPQQFSYEPKDYVKIFYHGSASHWPEIKWLYPIMAEVLHTCDRAIFEIIGDSKVNKLYRNLPRTQVIHPMSWGNYKDFLLSEKRDVGLCPLLDLSFNRSRSHVKFFDIARASASVFASEGFYSSTTICSSQDVSFIKNVPADWVKQLKIRANTRQHHK